MYYIECLTLLDGIDNDREALAALAIEWIGHDETIREASTDMEAADHLREYAREAAIARFADLNRGDETEPRNYDETGLEIPVAWNEGAQSC